MAAVAATLLSVQSIDRAPLNVDEELTRRVASGRVGAIFPIVVDQRGGGPVHFWLVHLTLQWPGGLAGLRVPSLVFFLLALPAIALVARELAGPAAAVGAVLLTACAPLALTYATFGRPHTLLLAWISWGTAAALRAARSGDARWWAAAGAALGTAVLSHPTAPIYALAAFVAAVAYAPRPRAAWPGMITLALTTIPYELATAHTLTQRYGVQSGARHGRTFDHKPVWEDALRFMAPHGRWLLALALAGVVTLVARRSYRALAVIGLIVALPVVFFTYVPANGLASLFFDRYVLPPLPLFLLLVATGATGIAQLAGRFRPVALVALLCAALAIELVTVNRHARNLAKLRLNHITAVARAESKDAVLFGSAGTMDWTGVLGDFNFGRGPNLLDRYLALRLPSLPFVDDDTCVSVVEYLRAPPVARHGLFFFYANTVAQQSAAGSALARLHGVTVETPAPRYFLVRTPPLEPRNLVQLAVKIRRAWIDAEPANPRAGDLVASDRQALDSPASCVPRGLLGDPDISPNFPEIAT